MTKPLLSVSGLSSGYGSGLVVRDVDLELAHSEVVAIVGRNGMGKTTLMHTLSGMLRPGAGQIMLDGNEITGLPSFEIWDAGVALVPQGRRVFATLTVAENMGVVKARTGRWKLDDVYQLFPRLKERRKVYAGNLSGGEQQMLAIGRALLGNPRILLLDEPSEGLAPVVVQEVSDVLSSLRENGQSILLVEQNLDVVVGLASRIAVFEKGRLVRWAPNEGGQADRGTLRDAIGIADVAEEAM
jgi:branched-chain amino acid transport system ATP-binding protein